MSQVMCCIGLMTLSFALLGCGQSGALHLPNDPDYDKRAKYLLYKNTESAPKTVDEAQDAPIQQQFAAPAEPSSTPSP